MTHALPLGLQILECFDRGLTLRRIGIQSFQFLYYLLLLLQIGTLIASCAGSILLFLLKEVIACGKEAMSHLIGIFLGHRTDGLPLLLHACQLIGSRTPVRAVFESLSSFA